MSQFTIFVLLGVTFEEQMEHPLELFLCSVSSMILLVMLIKVVAKERVCSVIIFSSNPIVFRNSYELLNLGAFAVYLEPWHSDIFEFLDLRKNHGKVQSLLLGCITFAYENSNHQSSAVTAALS